jgi:hypothetical protein
VDDDKYDSTEPANRPHRFVTRTAFPELNITTCNVCERGSGHHVHDVSPFPENHPHEFMPERDELGGYPYEKCTVCGGQEDDGKAHIAPEPSPIAGVARALADSSGRLPPRFTGKQAEAMGAAFDEVYAEALHGMTAPDHDPVNQPAHYRSHPSGIECIQITEHMSFNLGNAIKYIWRADLKGDAVTDLEKARWYIEREIDRRRTRE